MNNNSNNKTFDLEERTLEFSKNLLLFCKTLPKTQTNNQLIRSGTSVGANYIEANDALGKKDFIHRLRISRKEAKETIYWLKLIDTNDKDTLSILINEAVELRNILSSTINK